MVENLQKLSLDKELISTTYKTTQKKLSAKRAIQLINEQTS
jgi:hypothetical protein